MAGAGGRRGQRRGGFVADPFASANLLGKLGGGGFGFHTQFVGQQAAAAFILGQSAAALAALRQQPNELAVGFFVPRFDGEQLAGGGDGGGKLVFLSGLEDEAVQGGNGRLLPLRLLHQLPIFKFQRVGDGKPLQKGAAIEGGGLLKNGRWWWLHRVPRFCRKFRQIKRERAGVQPHCLAGHIKQFFGQQLPQAA